MTDFIKKTSQEGGSKRKETYIAHKRFRDDKDDDKKESTWIKKKDKEEKEEKKKNWIKKKKNWIKKKKKKDDKEYLEVSTGGLISGLPKLAKKGWK